MSTFNTPKIQNTSGGAPDFTQGFTVGGVDISSLVTMTEFYTGSSKPSGVANGAVWYDGTNVKQYINGGWYTLTLSPPPQWFGSKGVFLGLFSKTQFIYKIDNISSTGNSTTFGGQATVSGSIAYTAAVSNRTRGVWGGGSASGGQDPANYIQYITFASESNTTDFGDLTVYRERLAGSSNGIRGVFGGGSTSNAVMDYITIDTTGNAIDFGDLTVARSSLGGAGGVTYGLFMGGTASGGYQNVVDYITIATTGNATDFGDLLIGTTYTTATSNKTRTLNAGGENTSFQSVNTIQYLTTDTPGNAIDFGDLTVSRYNLGAVTNGTRAVFVGGRSGSSNLNTMDYVAIDTPGNATDFGDFSTTAQVSGSASGD